MSYSMFRFLPSHFLTPALAIAVLAFAGGCSSAGEEGPTGSNAPVGPRSFETVEQSHVAPEAVGENASGEFEDGFQQVFRDQNAFASFWHDLHGENAEAPNIDFSEEVVAVAMLGERPNGEYEADIQSITKNENPTLVSIFVTEIEPAPDCSVSGSEAIPYHIVKTDRFSTDQVNFQDNGTETKDCS